MDNGQETVIMQGIVAKFATQIKKDKVMFSGIVEEAAKVVAIERDKGNVHLTMSCSFVNELKIDQSVSHNGVCLTVVRKDEDTYTVTAISETLMRTNLGWLKTGDRVNLERSMLLNGRLDGHIVQGHVDCTAVCTSLREADGSWYYSFEYEISPELAKQGYVTVEKGSVCVNGVSLTVCNSKDHEFEVDIIPYTHDFTNFGDIKQGTVVNIEFDIVGKYISRLLQFETA
jgi:riboflavin synthase